MPYQVWVVADTIICWHLQLCLHSEGPGNYCVTSTQVCQSDAREITCTV